MARFGITAVLVGMVVLATYLPGRLEFAALCDQHANPVIVETVEVPGVRVASPRELKLQRA